jgi:multiple sugar transport system substrate-binding protein
MTFRPFQAFACIVILAVLMLSACQRVPVEPAPPNEQTQTALAPAATATTVPSTPAPTRTPTPVPSPTLPAYLQLTAADLQGTAIEFWHPWSDEMADVVETLAGEFNRGNQWGISVRAVAYMNVPSLQEAVNRALAQEDAGPPHVVAAAVDQLAAWSEAGDAVVLLDEYLRHPEFGFTQKEIGGFHPVFWHQDQLAEQQLGIPALRTARVLFYNQSWAKELGFSAPPTNTAEFKRQACAAAVENNASRTRSKNGTGGWLVSTDALTTLSWLSAFDARVLPENDQMPYTFESTQAEEALAFLRGMMDDGCAWVGRGSGYQEYFSSRMALFYSGTLSDLYGQKSHNSGINNEDEWIILPFLGKNGQKIAYASGPSLAVLRASPEAQMASWLFIRWMAQPRNLARLAELLPSIPVSSGVEAQVADYRMNYPWNSVLPLKEVVIPAPGQSSWRIVRRLLEDAAWQVYTLPTEQVIYILPQLEAFAEELLPARP